MREIKFRGYATKANKMIDLKAITPMALSDGMLDEGDGLFIPFREDIILMQYTGLKDKNGVEIYEGDIVRCSYGTGKVSYKDAIGAYLVSWIDDAEAISEFLGLERKQRRCRLEEDEVFEVIGDIYQSPEL